MAAKTGIEYELWQQKISVMWYKVGSPFSILATCYIMYEVLCDKKKRSRTYFRLILCMSFMEFIEGLASFCGPWCTPSSWIYWSGTGVGNMTTCNVQGMMIQFASVGSLLYSCVLG